MQTLRLATFNCENLFARFKFNENIDPQKAVTDGWLTNSTFFEINDETSKSLTGQAIKATQADVIAVQEVESLAALKRFRTRYLGSTQRFKHAILLDGNDPRLIDVGLLSKYPIQRIDTHIDEWDNQLHSHMFSRDCLECDIVLPEDKTLRLFVNHFKSMLDKDDPCNGRKNTREKRLHQSQRVKDIVSQQFPDGTGNFAIIGDFNDYLETDQQAETGIGDLVNWNFVENVVNRKIQDERWTHYFGGNSQCGIPPSYRQLDYILLSKSITENTDEEPQIIRNGLAKAADRYTGPRFEGVGQETPAASDHCPVVIKIRL
jgi:endonuclease/exonuclease/phosphatase family metal-dependent hydrolase